MTAELRVGTAYVGGEGPSSRHLWSRTEDSLDKSLSASDFSPGEYERLESSGDFVQPGTAVFELEKSEHRLIEQLCRTVTQ